MFDNYFHRLKNYTLSENITILLTKIGLNFNKQAYTTKIVPYRKLLGQLAIWGFGYKRINRHTLAIYDQSDHEFLIRLHNSDIHVFNQIIVYGEYSPILKISKEQGMPDRRLNIIDCGSNIGLFTVWANRHFPDSKIVCVEADEANYKFGLHALNKIQSTEIHPLYKALWYNNTETVAVTDAFRDGDSWSKSVKAGGEQTSGQVGTITLKDIYDQFFEGENIDILKIDIEGAEADIFRQPESFGSILEHTRIIAIEIHDEANCRELTNDFLTRQGFHLFIASETTFAYKNVS